MSEMSPDSMTKTMIIHIVEKLETKPEFQLDRDRFIPAHFATTTLGATKPISFQVDTHVFVAQAPTLSPNVKNTSTSICYDTCTPKSPKGSRSPMKAAVHNDQKPRGGSLGKKKQILPQLPVLCLGIPSTA